jgi:acyl dehydratase
MAQMVTPEGARALIGTDLGTSDWVLVDQAKVNAFADVTGDHQFIHVDPEAAAKTPFGGPIAHGFLTLSLTAALQPSNAIVLQGIKMGINYGCDKLRFLQPVARRQARARPRQAARHRGQGRRSLPAAQRDHCRNRRRG